MRLRRLCFEIFAFRLFFNEPIAEFGFCSCRSKHEALVSSTLFLRDNIGLVGFEPTASWSRTRRSTKLSHSPKISASWRIARGCTLSCAFISRRQARPEGEKGQGLSLQIQGFVKKMIAQFRVRVPFLSIL